MTKNHIDEIVQWADQNGQDAIQLVQDYMLEKDSRTTSLQAERLVTQARERLKAAGAEAKHRLLEALVEHEHQDKQIYSITAENVEVFLNDHPDLVTKLDGLDPEVIAMAIFDAIGAIGILELVEKAIRETIESAAMQPGLDAGEDR